MRLPTFSRQSDNTVETEARPAGATSASTPVRPRSDATVTPPPADPPVVERRRLADEDTLVNQQAVGRSPRTGDDLKSRDLRAPRPEDHRNADEKTIEQRAPIADHFHVKRLSRPSCNDVNERSLPTPLPRRGGQCNSTIRLREAFRKQS